MKIASFHLALAMWRGCLVTDAAVINITTNDNYTRIETANPGDEVVIASGTYAFRVHLTKQATVANPIIIRALDPANPPVWDFGSTLVENAPGSYTAGNDGGLANLTLNVRAYYNTFVGNGGNAAFIHVSNADGTQMNADISNNIISGTGRPALIDNTNAAAVTGVNNWIRTNAVVGTPTSGYLSNSVRSVSPGFRNAAAQDYTLATDSVCLGAASATVFGLPGREYYLNETTNRQWRIRAAARDLGAFASTSTNAPVGPYSPEPRPRLSIVPSAGNVLVSWPLFAQDFRLEQSALGSSTIWSNAPNTNITNATGLEVSVATSAGGSMFRLQK